MDGKLYIVATPIGNLEDITLRALRILQESDTVACEDTRHTQTLLRRHNIRAKRLTSYFEHNKIQKARQLLDVMKAGQTVALVSDAGTPGISDPGYRIIKDAIDNGIRIEVIPGPSAAISALIASGMPTDRFIFCGFLPNKTAARKKSLEGLAAETRTIIIYESPHRVCSTLRDIKEVLGNIRIACMRELTKKFEEIQRAPVSDVLESYLNRTPKGEFVIIFNPGQIK